MAHVTMLKSMARLGAIASVIACGSALINAAPAVAEGACSDIDVVFARGTNDTPGMGRVGDAFTDALRPLVGSRTVTTYAVNYPASYDFLNTAEGANDAAAHVAATMAQCPSTRIVLGGYSQGAAVVDMLAGVPPLGNKIGEIGSAPPLDSSLASSIAAVAVFGNPATKFSNPLTRLRCGETAPSIYARTAIRSARGAATPSRTAIT